MSVIEEIWNDPLYRLIVLISAWLVLVLVTILLTIAAIRIRRKRRLDVSDRTQALISGLLFEYLSGALRTDDFIEGTRPYSVQQVATVLERYVANLTGESRDALDRFFERSGMLEAARRMCRSVFWWTRLEGARILGAGGSRIGAPLLLDMLDDGNFAVRIAAARALGKSEDPQYIEPLLRALRRGHLTRTQIAEVLVTLGPLGRQRLRELVMQLPSDRSASNLRATTVEVLALVGDAGATPFVQYALASGDAEVRIAAFKAASVLRLQLNLDELRGGLRDPVWQVRAHAATAAGRCAMSSLVPDLGVMLGDRNWWVRTNAAHALYALGNEGVAMLESIAATHEDPYARGMALRVLTEDPSYGALVALRERLDASAAPESGSSPATATGAG